jgi:hypothetical protein
MTVSNRPPRGGGKILAILQQGTVRDAGAELREIPKTFFSVLLILLKALAEDRG